MNAQDDAAVAVELVFATRERQRLVEVVLPAPATVASAIAASRIADAFPEFDFENCEVGIWGRVAVRSQRLKNGDRVELYRSLNCDPREARRVLAEAGRTMDQARD